MAKYIYPHVNITTKALKRRVPTPVESTATTLLAPFTCDRGPENELVAVDTLSDFENIFGSLNYTKQGQRQILNIGKWLSSGGRVLACRLTDIDETDRIPVAKKAYSDIDNMTIVFDKSEPSYSSELHETVYTYTARKIREDEIPPLARPRDKDIFTFKWSAKYSGSFYNKIQVHIYQTKSEKNLFNVTIENDGIIVEKYSNLPISKFYKIANNSEYIKELNFVKLGNLTDKDVHIIISGKIDGISGHSEKLSSAFDLTMGGQTINVEPILNISKFSTISAVTNNDEFVIEGTLATSKEDSNKYQLIKPTLLFYKHVSESETVIVPDNSTAITNFEQEKQTLGVKTISDAKSICDKILTMPVKDEVIIPSDHDKFVNSIHGESWEYKSSSKTIGANVDDNSWLVSKDDEKHMSHLIYKLTQILKQPLETPFDTFIDCGYSDEIKQELLELFTGTDTADSSGVNTATDFEARTDAFLVLSKYILSGTATTIAECDMCLFEGTDRKSEFINVALYDNYHKIIDLYSEYSGREVYVPSTYFMAGLLPYNDITYGAQYPSAGLTRGVVKGSLWIDSIPSNSQKQKNYENGLNYIEKDSRGQYFMTQLTYTSDDTALKFVNNSRSLLKMKKELTKLARNYLHEFNDRITKANLLNALNGALSNWIQNRTLSYGSVNLLDYKDNDSLTNEELLIQLDIKFTGTIEIISVEFTVE